MKINFQLLTNISRQLFNNIHCFLFHTFLLIILNCFTFNLKSIAQTSNSKQKNNIFSQSEQGIPFIRNYTMQEYNANIQNWAVTQDKRGLMYFGNNNGVLEYDGSSWRLIELSNNSFVLSLATDKNGTVYVGGSGEFGYLASDVTGKLNYISLKNKINTDIDFNYVWKIHVTNQSVYFTTANNIFCYYNDTIDVIPVNLSPLFGSVIHDKLFVVKKDSGIYVLQNNILYQLPGTKHFTSDFGRHLLMPYPDNKILIATENNGFFTYDLEILHGKDSLMFEITQGKNLEDNNNKSGLESRLSPVIKKLNTEIDDFIAQNSFYTCVNINDNYIFGTLRGGIIIMNSKGKFIKLINKDGGLQNNSVYNLFLDKDKNLWCALNKGISVIEINSPLTKFNELTGLNGVVLSTILHNNKRYASTFQGIFHLQEYNLNATDDKYGFQPVSNTDAFCFDFVSLNNTLFALGNDGVFQIQQTSAKEVIDVGSIYCFGWSKKFTNRIFFGITDGITSCEIVSSDEKPIYYNYETDITGQNQDIKFTTPNYLNNVDNSQIKLINNRKFDDINEPIRKIIDDINGDLWLTTEYNGIIHLKFTNKDISGYQLVRYDTTNGLPQLNDNYVHYIDNRLVVATRKGIYKLVKPGQSNSGDSGIMFEPDTSFGQMLASDSISIEQIYKDSNNKVWIYSDKGILTLSENNNGNYDIDAVPFKRIPLKTIYKFNIDQNGIVWIFTSDGLYSYNPSFEKNYRAQYHTIIRKVSLDNDSVIFNGTYYNNSAIKDGHFIISSLIQPQQLVYNFDYQHNSIKFEFAAPFFENETATSYKYIMQGYNKKWSQWNKESKAVYTNLNEGTYYFKVKAKNVFGAESQEAMFKFTIYPPWYRTILAYIGYTLLLFFLIVFSIKLYTKHLKDANIQLEKIVHERTAEILQQKEELQTQAEELKKLSIVASKTDNAVMIMDANGNVEWINEGFTRIYGLTLSQFLTQRGKNILECSTDPDIIKNLNICINEKKTVNYEFSYTNKLNEKIWG